MTNIEKKQFLNSLTNNYFKFKLFPKEEIRPKTTNNLEINKDKENLNLSFGSHFEKVDKIILNIDEAKNKMKPNVKFQFLYIYLL